MHVPDGFIDPGTSAAAGAGAIAGVSYTLRRAGEVLDDRRVPLAGLVAAFVFAAQMINFPVAGGTSGHLIGGVLAAVLIGPHLGALCITVVVVVQALLFADGGLTALGINVLVMGFVTTYGGYAAYRAVRAVLPRRASSVAAASGVAAGVAVVLAALAFVAVYAIGGTGGTSVGAVARAMLGVHVVIGIGEGVITALTVRAVLATRPDLVEGAGDLVAERGAVIAGGPA